jgi:hypothetical protein
MTDTISSDDGGQWPSADPSPGPAGLHRFGAASRTTAMTAAVSLVLLGGVATVTARNLAAAADPAEVVPASAFALAQVDLSLPGGQADAIAHLVDRFPGAPKGSGSVRDRLLGALLKSTQDPHVDYDRSVKPWLGDRAAVAGWTDDAGSPQIEIVLESTNDAAARKTVHTASPDIGLAFSHGFAILASTQPVADAAVRAAAKSSLARSSTYSGDVAALEGTPVLTGWLDGAATLKVITKLASKSPGGLEFLTNSGLSATMAGRVVAGLRVSDDGDNSAVQLDVITRGDTPSTRSTSTDRLRHLPATTFAAAAIADPAGIVRNAAAALSTFTPFFAGGGSSSSCSMSVVAGQPAVTQCPDMPPGPAETDPLTALSASTGLSIPNDLVSLLGSDAVVAYGGLTGDGVPKIGVRSKPADTNAAADVVSKLRDRLSDSGVDLAERVDGGDFVVATTDDYAAELVKPGALGTVDRFADAMRGMPSSVGFAAYVDLGALLPLLTQGRAPQLDHLQALGMWTATVNGTPATRLRLVVH